MVEVLNWDRSSFLKGCVQGNIHELQLFFLAFDAPFPKKKKRKKNLETNKSLTLELKRKRPPKNPTFIL